MEEPVMLKQLRRGDRFRRVAVAPDSPIRTTDVLELDWLSFLEGMAGYVRVSDQTRWQTAWNTPVVRITDEQTSNGADQ